ncbi:UPF0547 protein C16orf87 homolog isoform X1 [Chelonoidis abingdonii]|uniref:UPF0547 protein C16orf87 homolog isoform X1 n=1 Tax=Chelonoidis abingdonii TaxID=106734 RepID=UPI0013F1A13A|nr:UPF0547 protein C16orf87 homolog isoform X1 [Chelonoidis abingdonii]
MSSSRAKKVKMATKSCPECDQQVPVACKSCPCGYIFISRKLLHAKRAEKSPPTAENKSEAKRRRTERVKREKINSTVNKDLENRKRSRSNSHSDHSRRGRGRPKSASAKKHEEERASPGLGVFHQVNFLLCHLFGLSTSMERAESSESGLVLLQLIIRMQRNHMFCGQSTILVKGTH